MFEVTQCADGYDETLVGYSMTLEEGRDMAQGCSRVEEGRFLVRGPGAAGLIWLHAIFQNGNEVEDCDHA